MPRSTTRRLLAGAGTAAALLMGSALTGTPEQIAHAQGTPGLMEFRWDGDRDYRKLYYYQTSATENDRSEWFLLLRAKDRKTAFIKLTVTVPDYFDSKLKPHRMRICRTSVGSMMRRSKCLEEIPAVIEVNKDQTEIVVFPDTPLPSDGDYSLRIKLFNPHQQARLSGLGFDPCFRQERRHINSTTPFVCGLKSLEG